MPAIDPLVSVIITCYNQERFIDQAIKSVLDQTYQNWECWIVDDGSCDNSPAICMAYAGMDSRIQVIRQENAGVSSARNIGFSKSVGKYIQFLDGDDWIAVEKLEQQVLLMEANSEYGVCYTDHQHYWQSSGSFAHYTFEVLEERPLRQLLFGYDRGVSIPIHSALLKKDIWEQDENPFASDFQHRYEDWVFWVSVALKNNLFIFLNQPMAIYRMHQLNFVNKPESLAIHAIQAVFYISRMIPAGVKTEFESSRLNFILSRYVEQKKLSGYGIRRFSKVFSSALNKLLKSK